MSSYSSDWISVEPLISDWLRRVRESQHAHHDAARRFSSLNYWLGIPTVVLSSIVGTSIFATLEKEVDIRIRIGIGLISVLAAVLAGLQTFLRFAERTEKHRFSAGGYAVIRREIEQLLALPAESRGDDVKQVLDKLREQIDSLATEAPQIPNRVWKRVEKLSKPGTDDPDR